MSAEIKSSVGIKLFNQAKEEGIIIPCNNYIDYPSPINTSTADKNLIFSSGLVTYLRQPLMYVFEHPLKRTVEARFVILSDTHSLVNKNPYSATLKGALLGREDYKLWVPNKPLPEKYYSSFKDPQLLEAFIHSSLFVLNSIEGPRAEIERNLTLESYNDFLTALKFTSFPPEAVAKFEKVINNFKE